MIETATPSTEGREFAATSASRGKLRISVIIGLLCCVVYSANFRVISAGDTYPARYLPFAIWRSHTVLLDPIVDIATQGWNPITPGRAKGTVKGVDPQEAFWVVRLQSGHAVSLYPVVAPLLVSPLYLPAVLYLHATDWDQHRLDQVARIMEKISATLLAAISAALFYLVLRRRTDQRSALLLTVAYAFGTTTWVISSQALWQHGVGELLVVCTLLLLTGRCTRNRAISAGLVLGLVACNRPPDALIAAALGIYGLGWAGRFRLPFVVAALLPLVPLLIYNVGVIGHVAGAYGLVGTPDFFRHNVLSGLAGLLFSPTKGLFVFSPFLVFVPFCLPYILRDRATRGLGIAALCAVILELLVYGAADWRQGGSWGPRWLTDLVPLLIWMLVPVLNDFRRPARVVFLFAIGAGVVIETIGAFWYTGESDVAIYASAAESNPMRSAWELQNAPFIAELRHPRAAFDLSADVRGYVDVINVGHGSSGREVSVDGWALADRNSPAEVVVLVDGHVAASTTVFGSRPDVSTTLGAKGSSGWHVTLPANQLVAGNHVLAVLVRANPGGRVSLVAKRDFDVPLPADLRASAHRAAAILASHQQQGGYWLTAHTTKSRFEHSHVEMNTFVPSMMLDMLHPVAELAGLQSNLQRARRFLSEQIEASGLVRYHGLANAPTIGTLGCAITPDADDTALAWRIAPSARHELQLAALKTLAAFRTADGLYRTWLAPRDRYECVDPGSDPNPTDIAIQMHVFLLLSKVEPPAAKALCAAIERSINDERVWVYYRNAPLIPMLRQVDLRQAGCSVAVPTSREQTAVPGQEIWMAAARMLDRANDGGSRTNLAEVHEWLQNVAGDDFSVVRDSPPLLYHNDMTASVSRFYWSEEFGYALWLRLYFELGREATQDSM